jgi:hypothetical protein
MYSSQRPRVCSPAGARDPSTSFGRAQGDTISNFRTSWCPVHLGMADSSENKLYHLLFQSLLQTKGHSEESAKGGRRGIRTTR